MKTVTEPGMSSSSQSSEASISPKNSVSHSPNPVQPAPNPVQPANTVTKVEDVFQQQRPMFSAPVLSLGGIEEEAPQQPISVYVPPINVPISIISNELLAVAIASYAQCSAAQIISMSAPIPDPAFHKTVSPPLTEHPQLIQQAHQLLPFSSASETTCFTSRINQPSEISFKELEQFLIKRYQMH